MRFALLVLTVLSLPSGAGFRSGGRRRRRPAPGTVRRADGREFEPRRAQLFRPELLAELSGEPAAAARGSGPAGGRGAAGARDGGAAGAGARPGGTRVRPSGAGARAGGAGVRPSGGDTGGGGRVDALFWSILSGGCSCTILTII